MSDLLNRRFLFVIGKGGVGKTTVATSIAYASALQGKRTLLAMMNSKERISQMFDCPPVKTDIVRVMPNFDAVNMTPQAALEEYGMHVLKVRSLYKAIFENKMIRAFLRGTPGVESWSMLGKAFHHVSSTDEKSAYDLVIVDAPATGHGIEMLRVPQIIINVAPPGPLRKEAEQALQILRDPKQSAAVLVTIAEDMPVNETIDLYGILTKELNVPVGSVVINGVMESLFDMSEYDMLKKLPSECNLSENSIEFVKTSRARVLKEEMQNESISRLKNHIPSSYVELPYLFSSSFKQKEILTLSSYFKP